MILQQTEIKLFLERIHAATPLHLKGKRHIAVAGPSGAGKSTIIFRDKGSIISMEPHNYGFSISGTTRARRTGEIHGRDYLYYDSPDAFKADKFLEDNAYGGNQKLYGTLVSEVERIAILEQKRVCFDIDINGAVALKNIFGNDLFFVFLHVHINTLRKRLIGRMSQTGETLEQIENRIQTAIREQTRVLNREVIPDFVFPYEDDIHPGLAANEILFQSAFQMIHV